MRTHRTPGELETVKETPSTEENRDPGIHIEIASSTELKNKRSSGHSEKSRSSDTVKFDPSVIDDTPSASTIVQVTDPLPKDETLRLFACMPKGFENFLESGPSRRVVDYMDYEKLCTMEVKQIEYLNEQKEPQKLRAKDIAEKHFELQRFCNNFGPFVSETKKKEARVLYFRTQCQKAIQELNHELPRVRQQLEYLKQAKEDVIKKVTKYSGVDTFIEGITRPSDSQFPHFTAIMDRHSTLMSTNRALTRKYEQNHIEESKLAEEITATKNFAKQHENFLRAEINRLKKKLKDVTRENSDLETQCNQWSTMAADKALTAFNLAMGIHNMSRCMQDVRPYTRMKLGPLTEPCDQIEVIGLLISDYADIVKGGGVKKQTRRKGGQTTTSDKTREQAQGSSEDEEEVTT